MAAESQKPDHAVPFGARLVGSPAFTAMFREGMGLVEAAAAYLDGDGRAESRALPRLSALAYASESMRLTTRLMQLASWLLLQRAVNEGEMSAGQASGEKHKVRLTRQDAASPPDVFAGLPERLRALTAQSLRLQERVLHLDALLYGPALAQAADQSPVADQILRLRAAFGTP